MGRGLMSKNLYALGTLWLQTGKPADTRNLEKLKAGTHLEDTFLSVERGQLLPAEALTLLSEQDIARLIERGEVSTERPAVVLDEARD